VRSALRKASRAHRCVHHEARPTGVAVNARIRRIPGRKRAARSRHTADNAGAVQTGYPEAPVRSAGFTEYMPLAGMMNKRSWYPATVNILALQCSVINIHPVLHKIPATPRQHPHQKQVIIAGFARELHRELSAASRERQPACQLGGSICFNDTYEPSK
jgi:hypothetical protein